MRRRLQYNTVIFHEQTASTAARTGHGRNSLSRKPRTPHAVCLSPLCRLRRSVVRRGGIFDAVRRERCFVASFCLDAGHKPESFRGRMSAKVEHGGRNAEDLHPRDSSAEEDEDEEHPAKKRKVFSRISLLSACKSGGPSDGVLLQMEGKKCQPVDVHYREVP